MFVPVITLGFFASLNWILMSLFQEFSSVASSVVPVVKFSKEQTVHEPFNDLESVVSEVQLKMPIERSPRIKVSLFMIVLLCSIDTISVEAVGMPASRGVP
jgi:hypothetical protein